jgi:hypothetical protein
MKKEAVNWKLYLRFLLLALILFTFYKLDFPLYFIVILGIIILLLILLRGTLYKKLDNFLSKKLPFLSKLNPVVKKIIIIVVFVLIYMALKWVIYWILALFGVDVQQMINESINQSVGK